MFIITDQLIKNVSNISLYKLTKR